MSMLAAQSGGAGGQGVSKGEDVVCRPGFRVGIRVAPPPEPVWDRPRHRSTLRVPIQTASNQGAMTIDQRRDRYADFKTERARAGGEAFPRTPVPFGFATCRVCRCRRASWSLRW